MGWHVTEESFFADVGGRICRHGCFGRMVVDGGPENKDVVEKLAATYGIDRIVASAYHPQANGMVERGHKPIVDALSKICNGDTSKWVKHLHAVLWADRVTAKQSSGQTPYYLLHGAEAILPIELRYPSLPTLQWEEVRTTADLLALRARQLERRDEDLEEAIARIQRIRTANHEYFDARPST